MKNLLFLNTITLIFLSACSQKHPYVASVFENEAANYLASQYSLQEKREYKILDRDSLRSKLFYSADLQNVMQYSYDKVLDSNKVFVLFTIYNYSNKKAPAKIVNDFQQEKDRRTEEGFYGPLGKDYQCFFQADRFVIHLEATCGFANEKELMAVQDSLIRIAGKYYEKAPNTVTKPCE